MPLQAPLTPAQRLAINATQQVSNVTRLLKEGLAARAAQGQAPAVEAVPAADILDAMPEDNQKVMQVLLAAVDAAPEKLAAALAALQ